MIPICKRIQKLLTPDLLKQPYKWMVESGMAHPLTGYCYIASEAIYHILGGQKVGLTPCCIKHKGINHWYLKRNNKIIDPTAEQFNDDVPYHLGRGRGFLTKQPSKRAQIIIKRYKNET